MFETTIRRAALVCGLVAWVSPGAHSQTPAGRGGQIQFVFTSDAHYGITRAAFRGATRVAARTVNIALVERINALADASFPKDGGVGSATKVGPVDFIVEGGDTANRAEVTPDETIQSATTSWSAFVHDYFDGLSLRDTQGQCAPLFVVPGNHEASNAVGFYRAMAPATDATAMAGIFNRMLKPAVSLTAAGFAYARDRVLWSRDMGGIHFAFLQIWPDSAGRAWLARDLSRVPPSSPVILFAHDQPESEAKHFINPNPPYDINPTDRFENILSDRLADGLTISSGTRLEQADLERFLEAHPNVTAYFHGNSNWNQFYDWTGPGHSVVLHTFRVDSPMKGDVSSLDETKLSYQIATIDLASRTMTVREVLWNAHPSAPSGPLAWGASTTVALSPRSGASPHVTLVGGS